MPPAEPPEPREEPPKDVVVRETLGAAPTCPAPLATQGAAATQGVVEAGGGDASTPRQVVEAEEESDAPPDPAPVSAALGFPDAAPGPGLNDLD